MTDSTSSPPVDSCQSTQVNQGELPKLYECIPEYWLWMPKWCRLALGQLAATTFSVAFLSIPLSLLLLIPSLWRTIPLACGIFLTLIVISLLIPAREWNFIRKIPQLMYELYDMKCNLSPDDRERFMKLGESVQYIIAMHPHGIIPIQTALFAAFKDQYLSKMYGFGGVADITLSMPFLRNIVFWLAGGSANYSALKDGLEKGIAPSVNAAGRIPRNLYILPGGVAEVFTSCPGKHTIVFKNRKGLCKLSLETGAFIIPTYVFGGTDFFHNLVTGDNVLSKISRKLQAGVTIFWGYLGLPIPFIPKITLCMGEPIPVKKWGGEGPIPEGEVAALHSKYLESMQALFEKYKVAAGYPDAVLEIQ